MTMLRFTVALASISTSGEMTEYEPISARPDAHVFAYQQGERVPRPGDASAVAKPYSFTDEVSPSGRRFFRRGRSQCDCLSWSRFRYRSVALRDIGEQRNLLFRSFGKDRLRNRRGYRRVWPSRFRFYRIDAGVDGIAAKFAEPGFQETDDAVVVIGHDRRTRRGPTPV